MNEVRVWIAEVLPKLGSVLGDRCQLFRKPAKPGKPSPGWRFYKRRPLPSIGPGKPGWHRTAEGNGRFQV